MDGDNKRNRLMRRKTAMWTERASWDSHWREIATLQMPRGSRFVVTDANKGIKRHQNIYDNTPIFAHRTLAAGMMSGMTSPARPWFRLGLRDKDLEEAPAVRQYLHDVTQTMRSVFAASNTYNTLHQCYEELGAFGTFASFVRPDFENVIHHYPMTVGEYALATNDRGVVDTLHRELNMTVGQMVKQFGYKNCSNAVKNLYDRHNLDAWVRAPVPPSALSPAHPCLQPLPLRRGRCDLQGRPVRPVGLVGLHASSVGPLHGRHHQALHWSQEGRPQRCLLGRQSPDCQRLPRQVHQAVEHAG